MDDLSNTQPPFPDQWALAHFGEVAEWSKAPVSKTGILKRYREFESPPLRQDKLSAPGRFFVGGEEKCAGHISREIRTPERDPRKLARVRGGVQTNFCDGKSLVADES